MEKDNGKGPKPNGSKRPPVPKKAGPGHAKKGGPKPNGSKRPPVPKKGKPVPGSSGPGIAKRILPFLDAIFFLFLMISASVLVFFVLPSVYEGGSKDEDTGMADLCTRTNQALLMSTVPYCSYTDTQGYKAEYIDQPVSYLLCQDIYIRSNYKASLDVLSLRQGLELAVSRIATGLLLDGYGFLLSVYEVQGVSFMLFNYAGHEASTTMIDPSNPEVSRIQKDTEGRSFHSTSAFILPNGKEARISFYLFASDSFDSTAVLGGGR